MLAENDKLLVPAAHLGGLIGFAILAPLVVYLVTKDTRPFVRRQASEAFNFHVSVLLVMVPCVCLSAIPIVGLLILPVVFALAIASLVFSILAAIKSADGVDYRYPFALRLLS